MELEVFLGPETALRNQKTNVKRTSITPKLHTAWAELGECAGLVGRESESEFLDKILIGTCEART